MKTIALFTATAVALFPQQPPRPKFDVAAIKLLPESRTMYIRPQPGGRLTAAAPVRLLLQKAYTLFAFQIVGGPDWLASDRYEIEAKAEDNPTTDEIFLMLQSLLEDRFQLRVHRESKDLPVYTLVAAKGGLKLPRPKEGSCTAETTMPNAAARTIMTVQCGRLLIGIGQSGGIIKGGQILMPELIKIIATMMGRPVIDKTGYTGAFDVELNFTPDLASAGLPAVPGAPDPEPAAPTIFGALQEKLGLKLESTKGPVEILVIDHVERPSGN